MHANVVIRALSQSVVRYLMPLPILVVSVGPSRSQVVGGTVQCTLTDASGAVLARVKASVVNVKTNTLTTTSTNSNEFYAGPNLVPGNSGTSTSATGFGTTEGCNGYRRRPVNRKSHAESRDSV